MENIAEKAGIEICVSGMKAHSSLGIGGRLREPLRQVFNKVKIDFPSAPHDILLKLVVKEMNDTRRENGLVPSKLFSELYDAFQSLILIFPGKRK